MFKLTKTLVIITVVMLFMVSCEKATDPQSVDQITITIRNDTDAPVESAHVRTPGFYGWGANLLSKKLEKSTSGTIRIPVGLLDERNQIDIQVRDAQGYAYSRLQLEIADGVRVTFIQSHFDLSMVRRFVIGNHTSSEITSALFRTPGQTKWHDIMAWESLIPGSNKEVSVPIAMMDDLYRLDIQLRTYTNDIYNKISHTISNDVLITFNNDDLDSDAVRKFTIINNTGVTITEGFTKKVGTFDWGYNILGSPLIADGTLSVTIPLSIIDSQNRLDIMLRALNGIDFVKSYQTINQHSSVTFNSTDIDSDSNRSFIIINNTNVTISSGWIKTPGDTGWSHMLFSTNLINGGNITITIPVAVLDPQNRADISLRTSSGREFTRFAQPIFQNGAVTFTTNDTQYDVGKPGPAGGLVFYDKGIYSDGWRYLEAAISDDGFAQWGAHGTNVAGTDQNIGSGRTNSLQIASHLQFLGETNRAAQLCLNKTQNGYNDWFLPSREELDLMYVNLHQKGLGNFSNTYYWSSSQFNSNDAWDLNFQDGGSDSYAKNVSNRVRAIRAF